MLNVLLECVRVAYALIEFVLNYLSSPTAFIKSFFDGNDPEVKSTCNIRYPKHLAVLYTEKSSICLETLCDLLMESANAGIKEISVYDPWSHIQQNQYKLKALSENLKYDRKIQKKARNFNRPTLRFSSPDYDDLNDCEDDRYCIQRETPAATLKVNLLGKESGKKALVKICRKLCTSKGSDGDNNNNKNASILGTDQICKALSDESLSEPDFLLKVGRISSMCGYPPWCLRVTEIFPMRHLRGRLNRRQFAQLMEQFSRRDQRFGR
ncbi:unnamed protein product [Anisakis simplex]|uniref:ditrans,polycis-polyprenyl diphosphate synthase [(2E,6E)-farnesyldiphosphate specific] n=1 Tax=Anisakis simplex TaxID=6269 RepID=A0A0M3K8T0_ANISI|nr:unnamed protein product [Anisakis simplex]